MEFSFYPKHEYACPHVRHCPHLGGAALGTLVLAASEQSEFQRSLHGTIDHERKRNTELWEENQRLKQELEQVKLELKLERQNKFATSQQRRGEKSESAEPELRPSSPVPRKKRGAPLGHPGWYRQTPSEYDWTVEVAGPLRCLRCRGSVTVHDCCAPREHLQEDLIDGTYRVVRYLHPVARCDRCGAVAEQAGEGEILGSHIGPHLRSAAIYLRHAIGISYRKVPRTLEELFGIQFTPAALIGFEKMLADKGEPVVEDIAKKLGSSDGAVHADETYWTLDGTRAYYWVHGDEKFIHFQFDMTRSGQVSRDVLGSDFTGTLVTDCYSGYEAHSAGAKQKCLAHLARTAHDWQKLTQEGSPDHTFFERVKQFVKQGCEFHQLRREGKFRGGKNAAQEGWLRAERVRLEKCNLSHQKAITLQSRLRKHSTEWLVFLKDPRVPPTNNLAERTLRPLVILRKITFGHRTRDGAQRMAKIMTVAETARRHGHRVSEIFFQLYTRPPNRVLRRLYAGGKVVVSR